MPPYLKQVRGAAAEDESEELVHGRAVGAFHAQEQLVVRAEVAARARGALRVDAAVAPDQVVGRQVHEQDALEVAAPEVRQHPLAHLVKREKEWKVPR